MISLLTQWYAELGRQPGTRPAPGDDVDCPDTVAAVIDLQVMFTGYVLEQIGQGRHEAGLGAVISLARMFVEFARETGQLAPGDFPAFLQRQAAEAHCVELPADL
jgi:hypothetical protein